jgi:tetratricopeptide (TPR) repeat protein
LNAPPDAGESAGASQELGADAPLAPIVGEVHQEPPAPAPPAPPKPPLWKRARAYLKSYFLDQDPTFWIAVTPALVVAAVLFVRSPFSNYIFDEQEALLANPYVNGHELRFIDAFKRDFWGLPPERSIGSYRPIPNLIWRGLWRLSELPWLHHWANVVIHALNASLLAGFVLSVTQRRALSWLAGACFLTAAVLTEAITGVVGIADVLGGLGVLLALRALSLPLWAMPFCVFAGTAFGLFSKESVIIAVPLLAWAALVTAPSFHPTRPLRVPRAALALLATIAALVVYTYLRRRWFPVAMPEEFKAPLPETEPFVKRALHEFLRWFQQPRLPQDPINNPLAGADFPHRVAGALRVYFRGLFQVAFPWTLSGDYSFAQEPVPQKLIFPESVLGAFALVLAPLGAIAAWIRALLVERRERRAQAPSGSALYMPILLALGLLWVPLSYFPHSNIPVLLPTVRAERFWYLPAIGTALLIGLALSELYARLRSPAGARVAIALIAGFLGFQALRARMHALDYIDDLTFWNATRHAVPNSAKAHLNYSVMVGARGRLDERLAASKKALDIAPSWPMAHVYYGDTLCRLHRADEAWPHYARGFELAPNDSNLIALGLQCLWDEKGVEKRGDALVALGDKHPGSWLAYLARDIVYNGEQHGGVEKKYRPRSYNEGPKN